MKSKTSVLGSLLALGALALATMGASCNPTGPFIESTSPERLKVTPGSVQVIELFGTNFALPTTNGSNFGTDIHVYMHYTYPDYTDWVELLPPCFAGWSSTQITLDLTPTKDGPHPECAIDQPGMVEFKVAVRTLGESIPYIVHVDPAVGAPVITSSSPASNIPYTPSNTQVVTLYGQNLSRPDTTGYTFQDDIQVYFRYSQPLGQWTQLNPPFFAGWSPSGTSLDIDLLGAYSNNSPRLSDKGEVQFKVYVRGLGQSNVWSMNVGP